MDGAINLGSDATHAGDRFSGSVSVQVANHPFSQGVDRIIQTRVITDGFIFNQAGFFAGLINAAEPLHHPTVFSGCDAPRFTDVESHAAII